MGCGWNPVCHAKNGVKKLGEWLGDGADAVGGWVSLLLIAITLTGVLTFIIATLAEAPLVAEIALVIAAIAFGLFVLWGIATRKKSI